MTIDKGYHIVRVGLAITFLWIGLLILKNPELWSGYIQSWALDLLPVSAAQVMVLTAVFDIIVGFFLLIDTFTWAFSLLAALHLVMVLAVSGIDAVTVRDVGLLAGAIAVFFEAQSPLQKKPNIIKAKSKK